MVCSGFLPRIAMLRATFSAPVSTMTTLLFSSIAADSHLPSGERYIASGESPSGTRPISARFAVSTTTSALSAWSLR